MVDVMPSSWIDDCQSYRGASPSIYRFQPWSLNHMFIWSTVNSLPDYTASHPRINAVVDSYRYRV